MKTDLQKPEILIFMSDQHNAGYMGCSSPDNAVVKTPNMDRLAKEGVRFENAYTSCPLCVPARMSFLTGRFSSSLEVFHNEEALRSDQATFLHSAGAVGYETTLIGRMHFVGEDQRHGFENRFGDDFNRIWGRGGTKRADLGEYVLTPAGDITKLIGGGTSPVLEYDRQVVSKALDYFSSEHERPQLTVVGLFGPHHPFVAPPELYKYYRERVDYPADYGMEENFIHPISERQRINMDEKTMLDIRAAYYGMITQVDNQLGEVYDKWQEYLKKSNRKGIFIYLSDHGEMAGQKGLFRKELFFDGSSKIPMIICGHGIEHEVINTPVSIMDISATVCELLGSPILPLCDGQSLLPMLNNQNGKEPEDDRTVFCEYVYRDIPGIMARSKRYKFIAYYGYEADDLLFDIENDPLELNNIARENIELCEKMKTEIKRWWKPEKILADCKKWSRQHELLSQWGEVSHAAERDLWQVTEKAREIPTIR